MNTNLEKARAILDTGIFTCALCSGDRVYISQDRGVKPLMTWLEAGTDLAGFSAADRVVGKATAMLYCLLAVREVHAGVISLAALEVLQAHGIPASYGKLVDHIQNRAKTGLCPMENATMVVSDPKDAPAAIREALAKLK